LEALAYLPTDFEVAAFLALATEVDFFALALDFLAEAFTSFFFSGTADDDLLLRILLPWMVEGLSLRAFISFDSSSRVTSSSDSSSESSSSSKSSSSLSNLSYSIIFTIK
jgi:hypothetical protein